MLHRTIIGVDGERIEMVDPRKKIYLRNAVLSIAPILGWAPHLVCRNCNISSRPIAAVITVVFSLSSTYFFTRWWRA